MNACISFSTTSSIFLCWTLLCVLIIGVCNRSLFLEYPDFNIPKLDPFRMKKPSVLRTRNPSSPISLVIHNSNVTIYGLGNLEITQIKYVMRSKYHFIEISHQKTISIFSSFFFWFSEVLDRIQKIRNWKLNHSYRHWFQLQIINQPWIYLHCPLQRKVLAIQR